MAQMTDRLVEVESSVGGLCACSDWRCREMRCHSILTVGLFDIRRVLARHGCDATWADQWPLTCVTPERPASTHLCDGNPGG